MRRTDESEGVRAKIKKLIGFPFYCTQGRLLHRALNFFVLDRVDSGLI